MVIATNPTSIYTSIGKKLLKTTYTEENCIHTNSKDATYDSNRKQVIQI